MVCSACSNRCPAGLRVVRRVVQVSWEAARLQDRRLIRRRYDVGLDCREKRRRSAAFVVAKSAASIKSSVVQSWLDVVGSDELHGRHLGVRYNVRRPSRLLVRRLDAAGRRLQNGSKDVDDDVDTFDDDVRVTLQPDEREQSLLAGDRRLQNHASSLAERRLELVAAAAQCRVVDAQSLDVWQRRGLRHDDARTELTVLEARGSQTLVGGVDELHRLHGQPLATVDVRWLRNAQERRHGIQFNRQLLRDVADERLLLLQ